MPQTVDPLLNKEQTGRAMARLVSRYASDLDHIIGVYRGKRMRLSDFPALAFFDFVRRIPYRRDVPRIEVVGRPARLLSGELRGLDCKKKSVLIAAWAKRNYVPYRFVAVSRRKDKRFHHVFPQLYLGGWVNFDATYAHYRPGDRKRVTAAEVI